MAWTEYHEALRDEMKELLSRLHKQVATAQAYNYQTAVQNSSGTWQTLTVSQVVPYEYETADTAVWTRIQAIQTILDAAGATIDAQNTELDTLLSEFEDAYEEAKAANIARYEQLLEEVDTAGGVNPLIVMSYPQLAYHMDTTYFQVIDEQHGTLADEQEDYDQDVIDAVDDDWDELDDRFSQIGDQARTDISDRFAAKLAEAQQAMIDNGTYSILNAFAISGMGLAEAAEVSRLDETLGQGQIEALSQKQTIKAQERRQRAQNRLQLRTQRLVWQAEQARRLEGIYRGSQAVVEGRTDVGPGLNDIFNATMMIGKGQGSQMMLGAFQPSQFIARQGAGGSGFDFSAFMQKAITTEYENSKAV